MKEVNDLILRKMTELMHRKNISRPELASKIGLHKQTIYDYFNGKADVSIKTIALISKEYDIDLCWWFKKEVNYDDIANQNNVSQLNEQENPMEIIEFLQDQIRKKDNQIEFLQNQISGNINQSTGT